MLSFKDLKDELNSLRDFAQSAWKLHVAARITRIPPSDIPMQENHLSLNIGVALFAAACLYVARALYSPVATGASVDIAVIALGLIVAVIVIFGFFLNLFLPDDETFAQNQELETKSLVNRWATYLFIAFILTVTFYVLVSAVSLLFAANLYSWMADIEFFGLGELGARGAIILTTFCCSLAAVTLILVRCLCFRLIKPGKIRKVTEAFFIGAVFNTLIFYFFMWEFNF